MIWIGLGIGLVIGVILEKLYLDLVSANRKNNKKEQLKHLSELKDRNEF